MFTDGATSPHSTGCPVLWEAAPAGNHLSPSAGATGRSPPLSRDAGGPKLSDGEGCHLAARQLQEDVECGRTRIDDRHEPINSESPLPWSHSHEPASVSKTTAAPYGAAENAYGGVGCCERSLRGWVRESKPVQSRVQAILRAAADARYTSIASHLVIA